MNAMSRKVLARKVLGFKYDLMTSLHCPGNSLGCTLKNVVYPI
jgi:hypothetical protein